MAKDLTMTNKINRRAFLKTSGGVTLFIGASGVLPVLVSCQDDKKIREQLKKVPITAWVQLWEDGQMIIYNPAAEMGQGSMTSLPIIFAEEMDADWSKVQVEFSPQEADIYGGEGWAPGTKLMFTVGSRTTHSYYHVMRKAGAQARYVLLNTAANHWKVPIEELNAAQSFVIHEKSGQKISFGELVPVLTMPTALPDFTKSKRLPINRKKHSPYGNSCKSQWHRSICHRCTIARYGLWRLGKRQTTWCETHTSQ
jgi:isoquinoline 1-oxidoreductase subunit beta